jgi:protein-tyrosine phosphatase
MTRLTDPSTHSPAGAGTLTHPPLPGWVALEGACNVRDLGGYPTRDGGLVRRGLLYRGDSPHRVAGEDVAVLRALGITTVVDLRREDEVARQGRGPVAEWAEVVLHLPLPQQPTGAPSNPSASVPEDLGTLYRAYVERAGRELALLVGVLANPRALPALVHCFAGKDRTGLVSALVLSVLGVDEELVAADYAASALVRDRFVALAGADLVGPGADPSSLDRDDPRLDADPGVMLELLAWLTDRCGGVEAYLLAAGATREDLAALRALLVAPTA